MNKAKEFAQDKLDQAKNKGGSGNQGGYDNQGGQGQMSCLML